MTTQTAWRSARETGRERRSRGRRPTVLALLLVAMWAAPVSAQIAFSEPGFVAEPVVALPQLKPVGLAFAPDGRMFVWQRDGVVRIFKNGALLPVPFLDIRAKVNQAQDRGLLGLALDPRFATNRFAYLLYTVEASGNSSDLGPKTARLSRVTADASNLDVALPGSEVALLDSLPSQGLSHSIGTVRFAPDETLFISIGDAASYDFVDPLALRAQDLDSYAGKILRINRDGSAPADNPFFQPSNPDSVRSRVWAYGLRNPFRFGLDPVTRQPFAGDVGWNTWEEINRATPGANFGWPCYEGTEPQTRYARLPECRALSASAVTPPLHAYDRTQGSAAVGGAFYTGLAYPSKYRGNFFVADYSGKRIRRMVFNSQGELVAVEPFAANINGPVAIEQGPDGLLYYIEFRSGVVGRFRFNGPVAKASANPTSGYSPLTVSFTSSGSLNPAGGSLSTLWEFGDGTTSTAPNPTHTYVAGGVVKRTAKLTVTTPGGSSSSTTLPITIGSRPPVATIVTPADGLPVFVGQTITYQGTATDPDQGTLAPGALEWAVLLRHDDHVHPLVSGAGRSGSFKVSYHGAGVFAYEVILTAMDASGLPDTKNVVVPFNPQNLPFASRLTVTSPVLGGSPATATVTLSAPAPAGGLTVALGSSSAAVEVPPSITVPAGATTRSFTATTTAVAGPQAATLTATLNGSVEEIVTITPAPAIGTLTLAPSTVVGGAPATGTVTLSLPAPAGGIAVALSSASPILTVPASVTVPGGSTSASFVVSTSPVAAPATVKLTAILNGTREGELRVDSAGSGAGHAFTYADRAALLTANWDFLARTASGAIRNTEGVGALAVGYDQAAHPGTIRVPVGAGELWQDLNDSENMLLRDLPEDWTSIRLRIAAFSPAANYQQVALIAYQDDDTYVAVQRYFHLQSGGPVVAFFKETAGLPAYTDRQPLINTENLLLRLDRVPATSVFAAFYSLNNGASWAPLAGTPTQTLTRPRLAIQVGANTAATRPTADLAGVEIIRAGPTLAPTLATLAPSSGQRGQSLTVLLGGTNFASGATCAFGADISVSACVRASSTQLAATIAISTGAAIGPRTVTVANPDGARVSVTGFAVSQAPAPLLATVSPASGTQGRDLAVVLTGTGFLAGVSCDFGPDVTVGSCLPTSPTELAASLSIGGAAAPGPRAVTVTNPGGGTASLAGGFTVLPGTTTLARFSFSYADRAALLAAGWDFLARTAAGVPRNTEQPGVSYDQNAHAGALRITVGPGEIWRSSNDSRNTLFRDLPSDWRSIRLRIAAFDPKADFQQVGLIAYQNDDTYVSVLRAFNVQAGGPTIEFFKEAGGVVTRTDRRPLISPGALVLRLDRAEATNTVTAFYSTDSGASWVPLTGAPTQALTNPRLAIQVGANTAATAPPADLAWVELVRSGSVEPPQLSALSPSSAQQGEEPRVLLSGRNLRNGATCAFGPGITVDACVVTSSFEISADLTIAATAGLGARTVVVTNPDGQRTSLVDGFAIIQSPMGPAHAGFTYPNRGTLLASGWDFLARTASGATRDTEQTGSLAVSYSQATHPGRIRVPLGVGEVWQALNNSQNMLLRDLPDRWTSIRVKISAFHPTANYQQVGLIAYQDDDTYVNVLRAFNLQAGGPTIEFFKEMGGVVTRTDRHPLSITGSLILRLDRVPATDTFTAFYSADDGGTWVQLTGAPTVRLVKPRVAIQVGANEAPTVPTADLAWVEVLE